MLGSISIFWGILLFRLVDFQVYGQDLNIFDISQRINSLYGSHFTFKPPAEVGFDDDSDNKDILEGLTLPLEVHPNNNYKNNNSEGGNDECPPCFNCMLPMFKCKQFSKCNEYNGRCECIEGFAGDDCSLPLCGALSDGNEKRPIRSNVTQSCDCSTGWSGINCNICEEDSVCDSFMPDKSLKGTCYKHGMIVNKLYQGCDVTNQKILQVLKGKLPKVTFSCDKSNSSCNFQFWIDEIESFYCGLDTCTFDYQLSENTTHYSCQNARCECIPGTMLCGAGGSIDIGEFLTETVKGPGDFTCDLTSKNCKFNEPAMDDLILQIFGDPCIELNCKSGECLHYSEIPGYKSPADKLTRTWEGKMILALTSLGILALVTTAIFFISNSPFFKNGAIGIGAIALPTGDSSLTDGSNFLKTDFLTTLTFEGICYKVPSINDPKTQDVILNDISGIVNPGQILGIMGGSGAGKTTLLDILAMKRKTGEVTGDIKLNGNLISKKLFTKMIGFVDQDDFLLPTLTVYETVLNSALLRLPRTMSIESKIQRVNQVLEELRIIDIKDRIIGNDIERGISGGEKRRVSIACELVTSPLILFLDEPTSGLDANNANNVIECLVRLAKTYNRTIVLSIHQPRSNIFNLFDKLVLLNQGEMVFSGDTINISEFLYNCGYQCPKNYNIADYLIDITFDANDPRYRRTNYQQQQGDIENTVSNSNYNRNLIVPDIHVQTVDDSSVVDHDAEAQAEDGVIQEEWEHYATHRDEIRSLLSHNDEGGNYSNIVRPTDILTKELHERFKEGQYYVQLEQEILQNVGTARSNDINEEDKYKLYGQREAATFLEQLSILCSRSFKNIYRNPKLLLGNYLLTVLLSMFLGILYYDVRNDISGFQNRMGLFFFILTYFGFITFTGLSSFSIERIIFLKERSNNYYSPGSYYMSKILSDVLPLRVIPPIIMMLIIYPMVGLNMTGQSFLKSIVILILFNIGISLEILSIGIIFKDLNNSIIISVLIILDSLLFSGLFINTKDMNNIGFRYFKNMSIFYYAYESLLINEVKTLILKEKKYGLNIEIPGATILSTFGFIVQNLNFDIKILGLFNLIFLVIGYLSLKLIVIERK